MPSLRPFHRRKKSVGRFKQCHLIKFLVFLFVFTRVSTWELEKSGGSCDENKSESMNRGSEQLEVLHEGIGG